MSGGQSTFHQLPLGEGVVSALDAGGGFTPWPAPHHFQVSASIVVDRPIGEQGANASKGVTVGETAPHFSSVEPDGIAAGAGENSARPGNITDPAPTASPGADTLASRVITPARGAPFRLFDLPETFMERTDWRAGYRMPFGEWEAGHRHRVAGDQGEAGGDVHVSSYTHD